MEFGGHGGNDDVEGIRRQRGKGCGRGLIRNSRMKPLQAGALAPGRTQHIRGKQPMLRKFTKKRAVLALSLVASLAIAGTAFAYFTSSGSGTGNGSVGTDTGYTVTQTNTSGTMLPGSGTSILSFNVLNGGSAEQNVTKASASVNSYSGDIAADAGDITENGTPVAGCLASWFNIDSATVVSADLAGGASTTGQVVVSMPADSADNQDPCKKATPDVTYSVS